MGGKNKKRKRAVKLNVHHRKAKKNKGVNKGRSPFADTDSCDYDQARQRLREINEAQFDEAMGTMGALMARVGGRKLL